MFSIARCAQSAVIVEVFLKSMELCLVLGTVDACAFTLQTGVRVVSGIACEAHEVGPAP